MFGAFDRFERSGVRKVPASDDPRIPLMANDDGVVQQ
jgi:hypothetical protein